MDPTCIICVECFQKSNHEGHRVRLQRGASGCCDCGDTTAWKSAGFCSDHQGYVDYTDDQIDELLPEGVGRRCKVLFTALGEYLHDLCITREQEEEEKGKQELKIMLSLGCISNCLQYSPLFIHYFTKMFAGIYPHCTKTDHEC